MFPPESMVLVDRFARRMRVVLVVRWRETAPARSNTGRQWCQLSKDRQMNRRHGSLEPRVPCTLANHTMSPPCLPQPSNEQSQSQLKKEVKNEFT